MRISKAAFDLIWGEEDGSPGYYAAARVGLPDWPGGYSGVTIGGFYDLGYVSHAEFRHDWGDQLPGAMLDALEDVIGIKGCPAQSLAHELHSVVYISEDVAKFVFADREIPKWEVRTQAALLNCDKLSGDSFGALVSLAMNRGNNFGTMQRGRDPNNRYREMTAIAQDMAAGRFAQIPALFRSMQRLWPKGGAVWRRREDEAQLFEKGLSNAAV